MDILLYSVTLLYLRPEIKNDFVLIAESLQPYCALTL